MNKEDFPWIKDIIADMIRSFLDDPGEEGKDPFTVEEVHGERTAEFHIFPSDHATCARIIGYKGERIKSIDSFIQQVGYAWRLNLRCFCDQPKEKK